MAKGLVGGVNGTTTKVTASRGSNETYSASIAEDSAPAEYRGIESSSMYINVDNSARTISGEVKWRSMIAANESQEDAYHAYPANKARINFDSLSRALATVRADVGLLESSCKTSTTDVAKCVDDLARIEQSLQECQEFCVALRGALDSEISTRELEHIKLRKADAENFNTLKTDVSNLATQTLERLDAQEGVVRSTKEAVSSEAARAKAEESRIESSLQATAKLLRDTRAEVDKLDSAAHNLSEQVTQLQNSDALGATIDQHTTQIDSLGTQLASLDLRLTSEAKEAVQEISNLQDRVYRHSSEITQTTCELKKTVDSIENLENAQQRIETDLELLQETQQQEIEKRDDQYSILATRISGEAKVRRETDVFHEDELARLELRISTLQSELVQVIQNLADELRFRDEELASDMTNITYDFIDAGNAPI